MALHVMVASPRTWRRRPEAKQGQTSPKGSVRDQVPRKRWAHRPLGVVGSPSLAVCITQAGHNPAAWPQGRHSACCCPHPTEVNSRFSTLWRAVDIRRNAQCEHFNNCPEHGLLVLLLSLSLQTKHKGISCCLTVVLSNIHYLLIHVVWICLPARARAWIPHSTDFRTLGRVEPVFRPDALICQLT